MLLPGGGVSVRLMMHASHLFCNEAMYWNCSELLPAVFKCAELILQETCVSSSSSFIARAMLVSKVTAVFRVRCLVHFITELKLLVMCLASSSWTLTWFFAIFCLDTKGSVMSKGREGIVSVEQDAFQAGVKPTKPSIQRAMPLRSSTCFVHGRTVALHSSPAHSLRTS